MVWERTEVFDTAMPPSAALLQMIGGALLTQAIHHAAKLNLAEFLKNGPCDLAYLAEVTGLPQSPLRRLLRLLVGVHVFVEIEPDRYAQSELSYFLLDDVPGSMKNLALMFGDEWLWNAWGDFLYSLKMEKPSFDHVYGMTTWEYFREHNQEAGKAFDGVMTYFSDQINAQIASAYDFSPFRCLVEVAGGEGGFLAEILRHNPEMKGILLEHAQVLERACVRLTREGVLERCALVAGDFFTAVPAGADAYLIKHTIRGSSDKEALTILGNFRRAMNAGGKIFVVDTFSTDSMLVYERIEDLQLLMLANGKIRSEEEFRQLFLKAGFELTNVVATSASTNKILEGTPLRSL